MSVNSTILPTLPVNTFLPLSHWISHAPVILQESDGDVCMLFTVGGDGAMCGYIYAYFYLKQPNMLFVYNATTTREPERAFKLFEGSIILENS
jgi:hypothetical protein